MSAISLGIVEPPVVVSPSRQSRVTFDWHSVSSSNTERNSRAIRSDVHEVEEGTDVGVPNVIGDGVNNVGEGTGMEGATVVGVCVCVK